MCDKAIKTVELHFTFRNKMDKYHKNTDVSFYENAAILRFLHNFMAIKGFLHCAQMTA